LRPLLSGLDPSQFHSYCVSVKNITVSVDDGLYHAARVAAADHRTSVSGLVRGYLTALVKGKASPLPDEDTGEERKNRQELVRLLKGCKLELGYKPSRAKTYEGGRFSRF
jgi:plasmid stability protein